jgi:hypothetical protein
MNRRRLRWDKGRPVDLGRIRARPLSYAARWLGATCGARLVAATRKVRWDSREAALPSVIAWASRTMRTRLGPGPITLMARTTNGLMLTMSLVRSSAFLAFIVRIENAAGPSCTPTYREIKRPAASAPDR